MCLLSEYFDVSRGNVVSNCFLWNIKLFDDLLYFAQSLDWEFAVINEKDNVNAFVVPGGKVVVYSGLLLNLIKSDDELAAVLAHEVAHVVARHTVGLPFVHILFYLLSKSTNYFLILSLQPNNFLLQFNSSLDALISLIWLRIACAWD